MTGYLWNSASVTNTGNTEMYKPHKQRLFRVLSHFQECLKASSPQKYQQREDKLLLPRGREAGAGLPRKHLRCRRPLNAPTGVIFLLETPVEAKATSSQSASRFSTSGGAHLGQRSWPTPFIELRCVLCADHANWLHQGGNLKSYSMIHEPLSIFSFSVLHQCYQLIYEYQML